MFEVNFYDTAKVSILFLFSKFEADILIILQKNDYLCAEIQTEAHMKLHIFNPEHDIALASNLAHFTAPHAGRQLRRDLGFLPVLWAAVDDVVLVDDVDVARMGLQRLRRAFPADDAAAAALCAPYRLQPLRQPVPSLVADGVEPWGWDLALRTALLKNGVDKALLPAVRQIADIRQLSHRRVAAQVLGQLRQALPDERLVGEACECSSAEAVDEQLGRHGRVVLKAPWSSSGRGIRFVDSQRVPPTLSGWLRHLIEAQGSVMLEPYYNNVKDFGMEFTALPDGSVRYDGLSLFKTVNGAYTGNVVATERRKHELLGRYVSLPLLLQVRQQLCQQLQQALQGAYCGPLGVDMMIVATPDAQGFALHPCVEINLRRTMGHVALCLSRLCNPKGDDDVRRTMRIDYVDNQYKLKILKR